MSNLVRVAQTINGDEKAMGLYETHEQAPDHSGFHRYQILHVVRDGQIAEFRKDMGLASQWKGIRQLRIPSLMEHSCDELFALADELRNETALDLKDWLQLDNYKPA